MGLTGYGSVQLKVREFVQSDTQSVVQLWQDCGLVVPWNDPLKDIERKAKVQPELFLIGEISTEVVASVMGGYDGHRGWINYLAVSPLFRSKQYGQQLIESLEARFLELGCPKINLQIRSSNTAVIRYYEQLGFQQDACVSMGKRLIPDS